MLPVEVIVVVKFIIDFICFVDDLYDVKDVSSKLLLKLLLLLSLLFRWWSILFRLNKDTTPDSDPTDK